MVAHNNAFEPTLVSGAAAPWRAAQRGRYTCPMRTLAFALVITCAFPIAHAGEVWTPEVRFKLESGSYTETLLWVSGFSYALSETAKASRNAGVRGLYCAPSDGSIGSREILEILNGRFPGKTITSEMAATVIVAEVRTRFPCK